MLRMFLPIFVMGAAVAPVLPAQAQQACAYQLDLREVAIAATLAPPPAGYSYAQQPPGSGSAPWDGRPLRGTLRSDGDGCPTGGVPVALQARSAGQQEFSPVRSTTTTGSGEFAFEPRPTRTAVVRAVATTPDGQTTTSRTLALPVRVAVSATYTRAAGCVLIAQGSTFPAKPGHLVHLQEPPFGDEATTATEVKASTRADAQGQYRLRWAAPCGRHDLSVLVPASASNTAGRTLYQREGVLAAR